MATTTDPIQPPTLTGIVDKDGRITLPWRDFFRNAAQGLSTAATGIADYRQSWNEDLGPNWALCDGRALSTFDYPALYAVISTRYGAGAGTFNVPTIPPVYSSGSDTAGRPALYTFIRAA